MPIVLPRSNTSIDTDNDFELSGKEHYTRGGNLVPIGGKLPYYLELPTGKILDIFNSLFKHKLPQDRKQARTKINSWLYNRTRQGFYMELDQHLHIAYAHQKDGRGTQHYWRLFFDEKFKNIIESIVNSTAIVIISGNKKAEHNTNNPNNKNGYEGLKEWNGMYFRSESEIALAEELSHHGIMFFANVRGLLNTADFSLAKKQATGRLEIDFLVVSEIMTLFNNF